MSTIPPAPGQFCLVYADRLRHTFHGIGQIVACYTRQPKPFMGWHVHVRLGDGKEADCWVDPGDVEPESVWSQRALWVFLAPWLPVWLMLLAAVVPAAPGVSAGLAASAAGTALLLWWGFRRFEQARRQRLWQVHQQRLRPAPIVPPMALAQLVVREHVESLCWHLSLPMAKLTIILAPEISDVDRGLFRLEPSGSATIVLPVKLKYQYEHYRYALACQLRSYWQALNLLKLNAEDAVDYAIRSRRLQPCAWHRGPLYAVRSHPPTQSWRLAPPQVSSLDQLLRFPPISSWGTDRGLPGRCWHGVSWG